MPEGTQLCFTYDLPAAEIKARRRKPSTVRTVEASCLVCLEPFTYRKVRRAQAFCSEFCRQLRHDYLGIVAHHRCRACGIWFPSKYRNAVYCSTRCLGAGAQLPLREQICKGCGSRFEVPRMYSPKKQPNFCSPACRYAEEYQRPCADCGATIVTSSPRMKWCVECQGKYKRDQLERRARVGWDRLDFELRNAYAALCRTWPCRYCGAPPLPGKAHADHAVPLSRGGSDMWHNLAPACEFCNCSKHAKTAEEFLASLGR